MAGKSRRGDGVTVSFGAKFAQSDQFRTVFREGMALVEAAATYLDGDGRKESRKLQPPLSLAYATESMRLTTRLMQLASWLLIRRAVSEGELTLEQAFEEQRKIRLPLDQMLGLEPAPAPGEADHPLNSQLSRLRAAFGPDGD
jgi:regulator of CtrA degradation